MKTVLMTAKDASDRVWHVYDLKGKVLGRAASEIARLLMGKHKNTYTPNMDGGDYVVALNASELVFTGKKLTDKIYYHHSNYPGGLKAEALRDLMKRDPGKVFELAVRGMLPKNKLQAKRIKLLTIQN